MDSKLNSQQALVHWPREITKGKLGQKTMKFGQVWANLDKVRQVWKVQANKGKFGLAWIKQ